jgi:hypothetical protein
MLYLKCFKRLYACETYLEWSMTMNAAANFSSSNLCVILAGTKMVLLPTKLKHFEPRYTCT